MLTGSVFYPLVIVVVVTAAIAPSFVIRVVAVVAGKTGRGTQGLRVAIAARCAAVIDSAPALVRNCRVRTVVPRVPIVGGMARGAIQAKHPGVENRVAVTTRAGR